MMDRTYHKAVVTIACLMVGGAVTLPCKAGPFDPWTNTVCIITEAFPAGGGVATNVGRVGHWDRASGSASNGSCVWEFGEPDGTTLVVDWYPERYDATAPYDPPAAPYRHAYLYIRHLGTVVGYNGTVAPGHAASFPWLSIGANWPGVETVTPGVASNKAGSFHTFAGMNGAGGPPNTQKVYTVWIGVPDFPVQKAAVYMPTYWVHYHSQGQGTQNWAQLVGSSNGPVGSWPEGRYEKRYFQTNVLFDFNHCMPYPVDATNVIGFWDGRPFYYDYFGLAPVQSNLPPRADLPVDNAYTNIAPGSTATLNNVTLVLTSIANELYASRVAGSALDKEVAGRMLEGMSLQTDSLRAGMSNITGGSSVGFTDDTAVVTSAVFDAASTAGVPEIAWSGVGSNLSGIGASVGGFSNAWLSSTSSVPVWFGRTWTPTRSLSSTWTFNSNDYVFALDLDGPSLSHASAGVAFLRLILLWDLRLLYWFALWWLAKWAMVASEE